jgi:hypothetical protein
MKIETMLSLAITALMAAPAFAQVNSAGAPDAGSGATVGGGAQGGPGGGRWAGRGGRAGGQRGQRGQRFAQFEAVLNPQQKTQYEQIMQQSRAEGRPLMQKMFAMRQQMQGGSTMDDKTKADFVALRKQVKEHHEAVQAKLEALLTPDQKAQLEKTGGMPHMGEHGGGWGGQGGGQGFGGGRHRRGGGFGGTGGADSTGGDTPALPPGQ